MNISCNLSIAVYFAVYHISFHVVEKSVHISSRLLVCVCTFLLVYKIFYSLLAFGEACFSFCIKRFQIFRTIILTRRLCSSSSYIFEISVKFQSFQLFLVVSLRKMTIFTFFFAVLVQIFEFAGFARKEIHGLDYFHGNGPCCKIPTEEELTRAHRFALRMAVPL